MERQRDREMERLRHEETEIDRMIDRNKERRDREADQQMDRPIYAL